MEAHAAEELAGQFRDLSEYINAGADPSGALQRIVGLAKNTLSECDWSAISQASNEPQTLAVSDDVAAAIDLAQIEAREGPCLSAAEDETVVHIEDLEAETRWPEFTKRALATTPVRSVVSFRIHADGSPAALNLYAAQPYAFDADSLSTAAVFAAHAQTAMLNLRSATRTANLEQALTTSRLIGTAVGIVMMTHKVTEEQAFELLRSSSNRLHRKLHDIADEVTATGELP